MKMSNLKSIFMETTIKINTDMLQPDILEAIKKMFPHQIVEISIKLADDTDYIQSNQAFADELSERIAQYNQKKETIEVKAKDLL